MLAGSAVFGQFSQTIKKLPADPIPTGNPYRAILRREYPEPFIALLLFILGIWLWDHYFGKPQGYSPGTEAMALVKVDRDLRLADVMSQDPPWLKFLASADEPAVARKNAMRVFEKLGEAGSLTYPGLIAYSVIKANDEKQPPREVIARVLEGKATVDFREISDGLATHGGTWWDAALADSFQEKSSPVGRWRDAYSGELLQLRAKAIASRSAVWILGLVGLFFIPGSLRLLGKGWQSSPRNYGDAWTLPLGMVVFLVATLAWIGFVMTLEIGIETLPGLHPAMGIFLDSVARALPALIAVALLFRRHTHVLRVMGLARSVAWRPILGIFSMLMILDQLLRLAVGDVGASDPGGGLNGMDAGWWGLAFALVSACLLGPATEEVLYRGILFRSIKNRLGMAPGVLLSSTIFAIVHFYDGYGLASVGLFGASCAVLYAATGSLTSAIVLHVLYNSAIKLPEWIVYHSSLS